MTEQAAVTSESYLLLPHTVTDLDDFVARPEHYLVSLDAEPERAARLWVQRLKGNPYGSEGLVRLEYWDHDLLPADLWDDVSGIWSALVTSIEDYLATGSGEGLLYGQPVEVGLQRTRAGALFRVADFQLPVDPADFIPGVLTEAARYFRWVEHWIGESESEVLGRIEAAAERARTP